MCPDTDGLILCWIHVAKTPSYTAHAPDVTPDFLECGVPRGIETATIQEASRSCPEMEILGTTLPVRVQCQSTNLNPSIMLYVYPSEHNLLIQSFFSHELLCLPITVPLVLEDLS